MQLITSPVFFSQTASLYTNTAHTNGLDTSESFLQTLPKGPHPSTTIKPFSSL